MKTNILNIMAIGALVFGAVSCDDNNWGPNTGEEGSLQLSSLSIDMSDAEKIVTSTSSRATTNINDFIVTITDKNGSISPRSWKYGEMPEVVTLPVGDAYIVEVESHHIAKAEWERPYYKGSSKPFGIENGKITRIGEITAKFASLKVSVVFADDMRAVMGNDVKVTVIANDEGELVYTPEETRAGYFEVVEGSTTMVAHFEGSINGVKTVFDTPFDDVEAGQYRIVTYKVKKSPEIPEQSGTIDPSNGIEIDASVENVEIDSNVQVEEDVIDPSDRPGQEEQPENPNPGPGGDEPGPDDPVDEPAATFEATDSPNLKLDQVNNVADFPTGDPAGNAIVTISCPKGIKNFLVNINSNSEDFNLTLEEMNMVSFDLAYPGEAESNVDSLGLPYGNQVINQTTVEFNITTFVPMLGIYPGDHSFELTVTDNEGGVSAMTLRFKAVED